MAKFRKKPVVIEAVQWTGGHYSEQEVNSFLDKSGGEDRSWEWEGSPPHAILIRTLEGTMRADLQDWIIKGVQGEYYPCKPDIFKETYEPVK